MSPPSSSEIVRRPISVKIFGIAIALLLLMIVVTLLSSMNLRRVSQQLTLLSDFYIRLDQLMGDVRAQSLREVIHIERLLHLKPKLSVAAGNDEAAAHFKEAGDCEPESLRPVLRKVREGYADRAEQQLMLYRVIRLCTNLLLERANALVDQALALKPVRADADQVARFTGIKAELANIAPARARLQAGFEKYLGQLKAGDGKTIEVVQDQIDEHRLDVNRRIGAVSRLLHAGTRESADLTKRLEQKTQWLSWSITVVACTLGLLFAAIITRNLVRPVRELLRLTKTIRTGNLDVSIKINTGDEIGQLADSFNHMVLELKQKELIKKMFGKYVDPRIVQSLLQGQQLVAHDAERQLMSVFFSDIAGFTAVCEGLTPTGAVRLINQYFSLMAEPIRAQQGIIDKYIGDSIMAFWGPPFTAPTEHAKLACYAALDQQSMVPKFQALLPEVLGIRKNVPTIHVRMGIATGDVIVGSIGSEDTRSYTVIGDNVNLASRLEGANKTYGTRILISEDTRTLATDAIEAREIDSMRVVGKTDPVRVYELIGRRDDISASVAELRSHYERALGLYRARKWGEARAAFEQCLKINPEDGPSLLFAERIQVLEGQTLSGQWDGVWTLTEK
jgi:class 3 adenylate cyclase